MPSYVNIGHMWMKIQWWISLGYRQLPALRLASMYIFPGIGIGGVLEPVQAAPVIIEDNCFIGSRCIVVEGVRVEKEAVLGANVVLTMSTKVIDVTGLQQLNTKA